MSASAPPPFFRLARIQLCRFKFIQKEQGSFIRQLIMDNISLSSCDICMRQFVNVGHCIHLFPGALSSFNRRAICRSCEGILPFQQSSPMVAGAPRTLSFMLAASNFYLIALNKFKQRFLGVKASHLHRALNLATISTLRQQLAAANETIRKKTERLFDSQATINQLKCKNFQLEAQKTLFLKETAHSEAFIQFLSRNSLQSSESITSLLQRLELSQELVTSLYNRLLVQFKDTKVVLTKSLSQSEQNGEDLKGRIEMLEGDLVKCKGLLEAAVADANQAWKDKEGVEGKLKEFEVRMKVFGEKKKVFGEMWKELQEFMPAQ